MSQKTYALDIFQDTGLTGACLEKFPMEKNLKFSLTEGEKLNDPSIYEQLIGRLIYLIVTRPDIVYSVCMFSQFMHEPRKPLWEAALRVLRYIKVTPGQELLLPYENNLRLQLYCNFDWGGCRTTKRSISWFCIFLENSIFSWNSGKQTNMSKSSVEVKYRAMTNTYLELTWLRYILQDLKVSLYEPTLLYCDNQAALHIAANPVFHERTKHIKICFHIVQKKLQAGIIKPCDVSTKMQLTDIFTISFGKTTIGSIFYFIFRVSWLLVFYLKFVNINEDWTFNPTYVSHS